MHFHSAQPDGIEIPFTKANELWLIRLPYINTRKCLHTAAFGLWSIHHAFVYMAFVMHAKMLFARYDQFVFSRTRRRYGDMAQNAVRGMVVVVQMPGGILHPHNWSSMAMMAWRFHVKWSKLILVVTEIYIRASAAKWHRNRRLAHSATTIIRNWVVFVCVRRMWIVVRAYVNIHIILCIYVCRECRKSY